MGYGTGIKDTRRSQANTPRALVRLGVDVPLLLIMFTLLVFGILMVYSASWDFSREIYGEANFILRRQLLWVTLGLGVMTFCAFFDYRFWRKLAVPAMLLTILALAAVLVANEVRFGAARTLFQGSYQPSELAKIVIVIYLSVWLFSKRDFLGDVSIGLFPLAGILGIVGGLIFLQPDLSAVLTVTALGGLMFFLAGGDMKQIILLLIITLVVGWLVVKVNPTGQKRVADYLEGVRNPIEASYHVRRSWEAFVKGGFWGVGIGRADTKLTGLPVPPTDSIFAVIGEETGVLGATAVMLLYAGLLWRGLEIARKAPDFLGSLLAGGVAIWIAMEAFINMMVIVGLAPFAGNALPFVSAGGSNMLASLMGIGILLNVSRLGYRAEQARTSHVNPVVDFSKRAASPARKRRPISRVQTPAVKPTASTAMASRPKLSRRDRHARKPRKER